jgi:hypothetical protein
MATAENYRKRAAGCSASHAAGPTLPKTPLGRKHEALTDMADNDDWLNGKSALQPRAMLTATLPSTVEEGLPCAGRLVRTAAFLFSQGDIQL